MALREALSHPLSPLAQEALRLYEGDPSAPAGCGTQWRAGFSHPTGLDYAGVAVVAGAMGIDLQDVLPYLQVLELEQIGAWAKETKSVKRA